MVMCCPLSGSDDCERPSVHDVSLPRARKGYSCTECGDGGIKKGDRYELVKGMWDGAWDTHRTCLSCVEIRDHFACDGFIYGQLWEDIENNFFPDMKCGGPCMEGLSVAAKTRLIDLRMEWLLEQDEIDDSAWEDFREDPNRQKPRVNPYALATVLAEVDRERQECDRYFSDRDREVAWYWSH